MITRAWILIGLMAAMSLSACATFKSLPDKFLYETSLRGEQGFPGRAARVESAQTLLKAGVVMDPKAALEAALPHKEIKIRQWGLRYFNADWTRYQVVLDADIGTGKARTKCREVSTDGPVAAPTLKELRAEKGQILQDHLDQLIQACIAKAA